MLENLSGKDIKSQFKNNKTLRLVTYAVGAVVVIVLGYFAYNTFVYGPANEKSKDAYWAGLNYASKDSVDQAIDRLRPVVKKYDGKVGGENAQFILARMYMSKGEFKKALKELEGVDVSDTYLAVYTLGLQGDCYSELGKFKDAKEMYLDAAETNENEKTTPEYLFKAALCAELRLGDVKGAAELYKRIKDNYTMFSQIKAIDKYIARTENQKK